MLSRSVVFAEPVRTPIGTFGGSLKDLPAPALGAVAIGAAVKRAGLRPEEVETVVMGNVVQAGTKMNPARQAAVDAGLPVTVPALVRMIAIFPPRQPLSSSPWCEPRLYHWCASRRRCGTVYTDATSFTQRRLP
jgi:hypothetical protein